MPQLLVELPGGRWFPAKVAAVFLFVLGGIIARIILCVHGCTFHIVLCHAVSPGELRAGVLPPICASAGE